MKKRILSIAVAMAMCLALLPPGTARAATVTRSLDSSSVNLTTGGSYIITQSDPSVPVTNTITIGASGSSDVFDVTLRNVNIDVSQKQYGTAIKISSGAQVTITLEGDNYVKSWEKRAGIDTGCTSFDKTVLTIRGNGSL